MNDKALVERLYDEADRRHGSIGSLRSIEWEAADTIEDQATRIETLEAALRECATAYNGYAAQIIAKQALESKP